MVYLHIYYSEYINILGDLKSGSGFEISVAIFYVSFVLVVGMVLLQGFFYFLFFGGVFYFIW